MSSSFCLVTDRQTDNGLIDKVDCQVDHIPRFQGIVVNVLLLLLIQAATFLSMFKTTVAPRSIIALVSSALGFVVLPMMANFQPERGLFPSGLELTGPALWATTSLGNTRSRLTGL